MLGFKDNKEPQNPAAAPQGQNKMDGGNGDGAVGGHMGSNFVTIQASRFNAANFIKFPFQLPPKRERLMLNCQVMIIKLNC